MKHALYSPSRLATLAKCPGFLSGPAGAAAERGSEIDRCVTALLNGESCDVPAEHVDSVEWAVAQHRALAEEVGSEPETQVKVQTSLHGVSGYLDVRAVNTFDLVGMVTDTKSGYGDQGDPAESPQLMAYAEGTLREYPDLERIILAFVQTDRRRVVRADVTAEQVRAFVPRLAEIIKRAKADDPLEYGCGRWCGWCVRAIGCPAVSAGALVPVSAAPSIPDAAAMQPGAVAAFLDRFADRIEIAETVLAQVKARAHAILEAGGDVDGWRLVPGRKVRKWADEAAAAERCEEWAREQAGRPLEDLYETSLLSPAQMEKLDKSLKPIVAGLVEVKQSPKLVKDEAKKIEEAA